MLFSSLSVMSDSLRPHRLQHTRLLYPPLYPRVCSDSRPLIQQCFLTISSFAAPFSFCLHSFPASGSFPMSWLFTSGGQNIGTSASVLPMNIQGWSPLGLTWSFSSRDSQESSLASQFKSMSSLALILLYDPTITCVHDYWKNHNFNYSDLCQKSVCFLICCLVLS